jgi:hypothetical protein
MVSQTSDALAMSRWARVVSIGAVSTSSSGSADRATPLHPATRSAAQAVDERIEHNLSKMDASEKVLERRADLIEAEGLVDHRVETV